MTCDIAVDYEFYRGDDWKLLVKITQDSVAVDITGYEFFWTVKESESDTDDDAVLELDVTSLSDPTNGKALLIASNTLTNDITPKIYWYDIQMKSDIGYITTLKKGKIRVLTDITRRVE